MKHALLLFAAVLCLAASAGSAEPPAPTRILVLGNSITRHGPKPDIGWTGNWGMAATAAEKDYVHLLTRALAAKLGTPPQVMIENIADFERKPETFDYTARLGKHLAEKPQIIIVAIGENVRAPATDEAKAAFRKHFHKLLTTLNSSGTPTIYVRTCFWANPAKDEILKQVATDTGATCVDISALSKDPSNYARSEQTLSHAGVAAHPGDKGMKAIADALLSAITVQSKTENHKSF